MNATSTSGGDKPPGFPTLIGAAQPGGRVAQLVIWVWSAILLAAMLACLSVSLVQVARLFSPGWPGEYLVVLSFLVSLEAILSWRGLGRRHFPDLTWFLYIGSELILILLAVKVTQYLVYGLDSLGQDVQRWNQDFSRYFFDPETVAVLAVLLLVWGGSRQAAADLALLDVDAQTLTLEEESGISEARLAARERLATWILWLGALITLAVSILHMEDMASWFSLPALRAGVYNLLAYFLLALVLLSLTQYLTLRIEWERQRLAIPAGLAARWGLYSLASIGLVALVAAHLPTGYSLGLLETFGYLIEAIRVGLQILFGILLLPFLFLAWLIGWLFGIGSQPPPAPSNPLPPAWDSSTAPIPWLELLRAILFWSSLLAIVVGALVYYLRDRRELFAHLRLYRVTALLADFWTWLSGIWRQASRQASEAVVQGWDRLRQRWQARPAARPVGWISLRRLSPRQRVFFYYLALLRRSDKWGHPRRKDQTPYEYMGDLVEIIQLTPGKAERGIIVHNADPAQVSGPTTGRTADLVEQEGLEQSIRSLTEQFVEARYSRHAISQQQATLAQCCWETIRRFLRRFKPVE